jgi:hypothetical protein
MQAMEESSLFSDYYEKMLPSIADAERAIANMSDKSFEKKEDLQAKLDEMKLLTEKRREAIK